MLIKTLLVTLLCLLSPLIALRSFWKSEQKKTRIIEGEIAKQSEYPFMASIIYKGKHVCGGSIISRHFILTAAHCTFTHKGVPRELERTEISVGSAEWEDGVKYQPTKRYAHDDYNKAKTIYDIGLFKTETINFGETVYPVKLNTRFLEDVGLVCNVLGWGYTSEDGLLKKKASKVLYVVSIHTISFEDCKKTYKNIYKGAICLTAEGRKGSCSGDSGSPLVTMVDGETVQIGLVSYGGDCNNTLPEVHTRISMFYDWIVKTTRKLQD